MKYVAWNFRSLTVPMILGDDGVLYTTSNALCSALGISLSSLTHMYKRCPERFSDLRLTQNQSKEGFLERRKEFGIGRVRAMSAAIQAFADEPEPVRKKPVRNLKLVLTEG